MVGGTLYDCRLCRLHCAEDFFIDSARRVAQAGLLSSLQFSCSWQWHYHLGLHLRNLDHLLFLIFRIATGDLFHLLLIIPLITCLATHDDLHHTICVHLHVLIVTVRIELPQDWVQLDLPEAVSRLTCGSQQQQSLQVRDDDVVLWLASLVGVEKLALVEHALGVIIRVLLIAHERQQQVRQQIRSLLIVGCEQFRMDWGVEGAVFDRVGNAATTDGGLVLCEDQHFGEWYDITVLLAWRQEVSAALLVLCKISKEIREVVVVCLGVVGARSTLDEAVQELIDGEW